jgi:hypothetical protein
MIFVGIDDTDIPNSPGTKRLARELAEILRPDYACLLVIRHQLLFDPRIPYTSKNSSACLLLRPRAGVAENELAAKIRTVMEGWFVQGSDPGLCVALNHVPDEITRFGRACQADVVQQKDAWTLAARHGLHLETLGGTGDGVIGALAAVGLAAGKNDGRIVGLGNWPDDLSGPKEMAILYSRGVDEVQCHGTGERVRTGPIDIGKRLRPNYRDGRVVLFVEPAEPNAASAAPWLAVRQF